MWRGSGTELSMLDSLRLGAIAQGPEPFRALRRAFCRLAGNLNLHF